jgi:hypothetical protein
MSQLLIWYALTPGAPHPPPPPRPVAANPHPPPPDSLAVGTSRPCAGGGRRALPAACSSSNSQVAYLAVGGRNLSHCCLNLRRIRLLLFFLMPRIFPTSHFFWRRLLWPIQSQSDTPP